MCGKNNNYERAVLFCDYGCTSIRALSAALSRARTMVVVVLEHVGVFIASDCVGRERCETRTTTDVGANGRSRFHMSWVHLVNGRRGVLLNCQLKLS